MGRKPFPMIHKSINNVFGFKSRVQVNQNS